jgi:hypothetical protein
LIVTIEDEVFASPANRLDLLSVFQLGAQRRHWVQTDPLYPMPGSALERWLESLSNEDIQSEVKMALKIGLEQDARSRSADISIRIGRYPHPRWTSSPPLLPLDQALRFLQKPLRLLVENRHNDGAFIRAVAPSSVRKELEKALENDWIEIEHGGGADMKKRLEMVTPQEAMRLWALSDSDAREPGHPSSFQETLRKLCQQQGVAHHLLQRRASENYLPVQALEAWVYSGAKSHQSARRNTVKTFARLRPEQRHHYNMKEGFAGDRPAIPSLFDDCANHPHLQSGFGGNIASRFHDPMQEDWLRKDGQHAEILSLVQSILRRL